MHRFETTTYTTLPTLDQRNGPIQNILVYHINGLTHAGTEKNLQLIANGLADDFNVFFMYGKKTAEESRKELLDSRIVLIPFTFDTNDITVPHRITGMDPHFKEILTKYGIDLIITASPGYSHYPWNVVTEIPIILSNVFGAPAHQKNIVATIFMSETVRRHSEYWTGPRKGNHTRFLPIGKLPPDNARELGAHLRKQLGIPETDFVFGRIGRDDDNIFDPIGIRAWQKIAADHPNVHYLIMSPPPILVKLVQDEQIPRVHFLPPSGKEEDVWAFHGGINCMAHFRRDGETSGVAIAESLIVGNPIITHRSCIWNAHLEYLSEECARVADLDNIDEYASFMREFIETSTNDKFVWKKLQEKAKQTGESHFSPEQYMQNFRAILQQMT